VVLLVLGDWRSIYPPDSTFTPRGRPAARRRLAGRSV